MTEMILDVHDLPETVYSIISTRKVRFLEDNGTITLTPLAEKNPRFDLLVGMFSNGKMSVDGFLMEKRKELEYINMSPIEMDAEITDDVLINAGRLKSLYKISLADSVGLAKTRVSGGYFVTAAHHEMDILEERENTSIIWIRDKQYRP